MTKLDRLARASIHRSNPWRDPDLARALAEEQLDRLIKLTGLRTYTSSALLPDELEEGCLGVLGSEASAQPIEVHSFEPSLPTRYAELGMRPSLLEPRFIVEQLDKALEFAGRVPAAARSIEALARVIHPLGLENPDYDVSYSDPLLPFSIFVGVPDPGTSNITPRIAEGVLHEAMHLQLSLIEQHAPMIHTGYGEKLYSPWRGASRPVGGILHGLYVFRAIQCFMEELASENALASEERAYCARRASSVNREIASVEELREHPALTEDGAMLVSSLLSGAERQPA